MTEFKQGDRVLVAFEGVFAGGPASDGECLIDSVGAAPWVWVRPEHLTLIAKPLQAGDTVNIPGLDDKLPEPPARTVLLDKDGVAWQKHATDRRWFAGSGTPKNSLTELARTRGPLTAVYVP